MKALTARQRQILELIQDFIAREGLPPTIAELAGALGVASPHGVREQLQALARKGAIELIPNAARGIRLLQRADEWGVLPIIGRVAAGQPVLAEAHVLGKVRVDPDLFKGADYLLRVRGMSMRDAGILDGDLLAVRRTGEARDGEIVVARLHDEVTVKTLRITPDGVVLEPANPEFSPIAVDPERDDLSIEGVMAGLIRQLDD